MNACQKGLHEQALKIAQMYQRVEVELLDILQKLDEKKVFRAMEYSSLFEYCLKELKLSEGSAYNFINVSRKAKQIPEIKQEIQKGNLTVSKAKKIISVITKENCQEWLEKAKTLPKSKLEQEVAKTNPKAITPERAKYISENRLDLRLGVDEELMNQLKRIQDLISQKKRKAARLEDCLEEMAKLYLEKHDPVIKANRILNKKKYTNISQTGPGTTKFSAISDSRKSLPAKVRHIVIDRDQGQCVYHDPSGKRCDQKRWLDIDHKIPVCQGGEIRVDNLQLLCFHHHKAKHDYLN